MTNETSDSAIAPSREELDQPSLSARALEPLTRSFLSQAGVSPGMRVLDVWSGMGDLAFLARKIVGAEGHVTGVDPSSQAVDYARERGAFRGMTNVEFVEAEPDSLRVDQKFDAIVGRAVLAYRSDPARDLRALVRQLRPGGIVAFQEFDLLSAKTIPPSPMIEQVREWLFDAFARTGIEVEMGPKLYATFRAAGLPPPQMRVDGFIGGAESISPALIANVARMLMPVIEGLGVASSDEVQIDTLEEHMRMDLDRSGGVILTPLLIGAWVKLPG